METIQIQYLDNTIEKLAYIDGKSDWIDLRSAVDVELKAGEFKLIHLGIPLNTFSKISISPFAEKWNALRKAFFRLCGGLCVAGGIGCFSATGLFRKFQRAMRTDEVCGRPLDFFALPSGCGLDFGEIF